MTCSLRAMGAVAGWRSTQPSGPSSQVSPQCWLPSPQSPPYSTFPPNSTIRPRRSSNASAACVRPRGDRGEPRSFQRSSSHSQVWLLVSAHPYPSFPLLLVCVQPPKRTSVRRVGSVASVCPDRPLGPAPACSPSQRAPVQRQVSAQRRIPPQLHWERASPPNSTGRPAGADPAAALFSRTGTDGGGARCQPTSRSHSQVWSAPGATTPPPSPPNTTSVSLLVSRAAPIEPAPYGVRTPSTRSQSAPSHSQTSRRLSPWKAPPKSTVWPRAASWVMPWKARGCGAMAGRRCRRAAHRAPAAPGRPRREVAARRPAPRPAPPRRRRPRRGPSRPGRRG